MRPSRLGFAFSISAAAALLSGCGASQSPISAPGALPQTSLSSTRPPRHNDSGSWIAPDAASKDLLYASNVHNVTIFTYPAGKLEGTLKGFYAAEGECVDQKGDVYITDYGNNRIVEYAHGAKTPLAVLAGQGGPVGCSVDPATGDLAVTDLGPSNASIAIYSGARGKPNIYTDARFYEYYWCSYDKSGNLFFDGLSSPGTGHFLFAKLPRAGNTFTTIELNQYIGWPGGVQWHNKYVAIGDQNSPAIYEFAVTGSRGRRVGKTLLGRDAADVSQFFIQDTTLIAPNEYFKDNDTCWDILYYNYPAGGKATKKITKGLFPRGVAVSLAQSRRALSVRSGADRLDLQQSTLPPGCTF